MLTQKNEITLSLADIVEIRLAELDIEIKRFPEDIDPFDSPRNWYRRREVLEMILINKEIARSIKEGCHTPMQ